MKARPSQLVRIVTLVLPIGLSFGGLRAASAAVFEGQFTFLVTDPGSQPLNDPFTGTYTFDTASTPVFVGSGQYYYLPIATATLTGGDSGNGGSYVLDPVPATPFIFYHRNGTPLAIDLFFRNAMLNTTVVTSKTDPDQGNFQFHWAEQQHFSGGQTGIRGGNYVFTAPTLPAIPVPEPSALSVSVLAALLVGWFTMNPRHRL